MKTAKVTTLRAQLSRILDEVRRGEEVEILDRDVPIARLVPVGPEMVGKRGMPPWLEQLRRAGKVRVGSLKPVPEILRGFPRAAVPGDDAGVDALLDERREGR